MADKQGNGMTVEHNVSRTRETSDIKRVYLQKINCIRDVQTMRVRHVEPCLEGTAFYREYQWLERIEFKARLQQLTSTDSVFVDL